jgi:hypothetical protein
MSDYLWDKTGEPEEDVAQLENLLGALKCQPRPLEIPAAAMPAPAETATRPLTIFSRPRLALAASLILTLLAGAWFVTRQGAPQTERLAAAGQGSAASVSNQTKAAVVPDSQIHSQAQRDVAVDNVELPKRREDKAFVLTASASGSQRTVRQPFAKRRKSPRRAEESTPAAREEVATQGGMRWESEQPLTPQQREATEQLMFALRLASAKLNYAQREMQEIGRAGR